MSLKEFFIISFKATLGAMWILFLSVMCLYIVFSTIKFLGEL